MNDPKYIEDFSDTELKEELSRRTQKLSLETEDCGIVLRTPAKGEMADIYAFITKLKCDPYPQYVVLDNVVYKFLNRQDRHGGYYQNIYATLATRVVYE